MSVQLGPWTFEKPLLMAPMEGITDIAFRNIVRQHGCSLTCTQMIHAEALIHKEGPSIDIVSKMLPQEAPVGLQLCGNEPVSLALAAQKAEQLGAAFIDLNLGCPAKNVVKRGAGAALLKNPVMASRIIRAVKHAVTIPVTVKIRAGWDDLNRNSKDIGLIAQEGGASLLTIHARTRAQKFKGKADWAIIEAIKSFVQIPVIGNGDIFQPQDIARMLTSTHADGVMIARGALGNPWIFSQKQPTVAEIYQGMLMHWVGHMSLYQPMRTAVITFRKHIVWYTKGIPGAAEFRTRVFKEWEPAKIETMCKEFFQAVDPLLQPKQIVEPSVATV